MAEGSPSLHDDLGDRYAIERELGHGATATVYLARDLKHDRLVAVKVLSPDFALAVPNERFLREIRTTARLNHPHIVPLFDSGTTATQRPYYVMRYIEGEALRDRIARDGPMHVGEALRIARQVASALGHAHRHGVIHRDIKPGNIMLEEGHAWVADFGIARAIAMTDSQVVTNTGVTIGTPAYMSPEQAMGEAKLDARTDIYSLGCVLYEMLTGVLPFTGADIQSVMNKHLVEPLPSVRALRPEVPEQVEHLLEAALAKKRDDRYTTAAEFAQALSLEGAGPLTPTRTQPVRGKRRPWWRWTPRQAVAAGGTLAAGVGVVATWVLTRPTLDPLRYLVVPPFEYGTGVSASMDAERLLQDALNQWKEFKVIGRSDDGASGRPSVLARRAHAGWYIRGGVSRVGDSLRVRAALYGTAGDTLVRERTVNLAPTLAGADAAFTELADRLLFDDTVFSANGGRAGTRSVAARRAFAQGRAAVQDWELINADSAFRRATEFDPGYAQAHLWVAQVRYWGGAAPATWRSSVERAAAGRALVSSRDQQLSDALVAIGRGEIVGACATWDGLTQRAPHDFAAWYGLANCLSRDDAVLRDRSSPSGWRFRTSYHRITRAYQRAFQLLPSIHRSLRGGSYEFVRRVLMTNGSTVRYGHALPPETTRFRAYPSWQGDTLALVPYPGQPLAVPRTLNVAVRRERELFHDIATAWVTAFPHSADAVEALALSLDLLADPSAIDTLRRAREFVTTSAERLRVGVAEVWMGVRFSVPFDLAGVRAARALADSLLQEHPPSNAPEPFLLASIAVLTGRAHVAAEYTRHAAAVAALRVPAPLARIGGPLLVFAALGGPIDSLRALEEQVESTIDHAVADSLRLAARMAWLGRAGQLVFPDYRFKSLPALVAHGDYMIDAQIAFLRGDSAVVRSTFTKLRVERRFVPATEVTLDAIYPEARLLAALHDDLAAIAWLEPTLTALSSTASEKLVDPANAGALVQAMALRADLATSMRDTTNAARWARVVTVLWGGADSFLQPRVRRLQRLAAGAP
ncbi:MAG: protein kinase [Gemmatimonadales bacterium]